MHEFEDDDDDAHIFVHPFHSIHSLIKKKKKKKKIQANEALLAPSMEERSTRRLGLAPS
jgi:hypothetical protein